MALLEFVKSIQLLTRTCEDFDRIGFDNVQNKSGSGKDKAKNRDCQGPFMPLLLQVKFVSHRPFS